MPKGKKPKAIFDDDIRCPCCKENIHVLIKNKIISPAIPAEKELEVKAERSVQKTLK